MDQSVRLAQNQGNGTLDQTSVFALVQKLFGTETNAFAIRTCLETIVRHAPLQEHGTFQRTVAFAQLQKQCGLAQTANALPAFTETSAFPAQPQDTGTPTKSNASAETHWSGTAQTAHALNHTSCTKETA
jgi:hypothetical protein